jgi:hypothetical protein
MLMKYSAVMYHRMYGIDYPSREYLAKSFKSAAYTFIC